MRKYLKYYMVEKWSKYQASYVSYESLSLTEEKIISLTEEKIH